MRVLPDSQIFEVARNQKRILWLLLLSLLVVATLIFIPSTPSWNAVQLAAIVLIGLVSTISIYRLARALGLQGPWLYVACAFIPYVNTATLLVLNLRATAALQRRGIRVNLMGADTKSVENLLGPKQAGDTTPSGRDRQNDAPRSQGPAA